MNVTLKVKPSSTGIATPQGVGHSAAIAQIITNGPAGIDLQPNGSGLKISITGGTLTTKHFGTVLTTPFPLQGPTAAEIKTDTAAFIYIEPGSDGGVVISIEPDNPGGGGDNKYIKTTFNQSTILYTRAESLPDNRQDINTIQGDIRRLFRLLERCCRQQHLPHPVKKAPKKKTDKKSSEAKKPAKKGQKKTGK